MMTSTHRQIATRTLELPASFDDPVPSLTSLRLGLGLIFCGMMLTLSVTFSLAAEVPQRAAEPVIAVSKTSSLEPYFRHP